MTDLNDVNIKELLAKSDEELRAELEAMLPKPTHPEHLLGVWAKHPEYGDVLIGDDVPVDSCVVVIVRDSERAAGSSRKYVELSSLTFPEQTTRPEDVPVGEAWLVNVNDGEHVVERVVALKHASDDWRTGVGVVDDEYWWRDDEVTLITPLVPAQPEPEPQSEPEPEPEHPRTLSSVEDYENAPVGTIVAAAGPTIPWCKLYENVWGCAVYYQNGSDDSLSSEGERAVLRWGWGNE